MRIIAKTLVATIFGAFAVGSAGATVLSETETVTLAPSQISTVYDPVNDPINGIPGEDWAVFLTSSAIPVAQAGDSINFRIIFGGGDRLRISDTGNGYLNGAENLLLAFRLNEGTTERVSFRFDYEIHFLDSVGDLITNPYVNDIVGGGAGLSVYVPFSVSLTSSEFSFSGIEFRVLFSEYMTTGSPLIPNSIYIRAGEIKIDSVSEPTTLALFGLGLAGLGAIRKKLFLTTVTSNTLENLA